MEPLEVTATLWGRVILPPYGHIHLDALLAWAVCESEMRPPALDEEQITAVEIPIERSECGRFHLCSSSSSTTRERDKRWLNKRFPIGEWQMLGGGKSAQRVQTGAGPSKGFRVPVEAVFLDGDRLTWWCVGERAPIERLLRAVTHVGRRRAVGEGEVREWSVSPCEAWPGFPILRDGAPLRPLPYDDGRVTGAHVLRMGRYTFPYWLRALEDLVAVPC